MQKTSLSTHKKSQILVTITCIIIATSTPFFLPHFLHGHVLHTSIHIAGIVLGSFLSIIGFLTYLEYKANRLFLVFLAFSTVTIAEMLSAANMVFLFWPSYSSIDSTITHFLILMMLAFFAVGIFRRD